MLTQNYEKINAIFKESFDLLWHVSQFQQYILCNQTMFYQKSHWKCTLPDTFPVA